MSTIEPPFVSYSINLEDVLLNRVFGGQPVGHYVDVGAAHPTHDNDTKALYDRGWSGVNIEPDPTFFMELAAERTRDRNINAAISDVPGTLTYYEVTGTGLSTCDPDQARRAAARGHTIVERRVEAMALRQVLDEARLPSIDLLKVDVEGFELKVLESNDWARFRPSLVLVEATYPESPERRPDLISPLLERHGYRRVFFDGLNDYFAAHDFEPPSNAFNRPINVFDHYVRWRDKDVVTARDRLAEQHRQLTEQHDASGGRIRQLEAALQIMRDRMGACEESEGRTRALEVELREMRDRLDKLTLQHAAAEARAAEREAKLHGMQSVNETLRATERQLAELQTELRLLRQRNGSLETDLKRAQDATIAMRDRAAALARDLDTVTSERSGTERDLLDAMLNSTSWRVTRPMRAVRTLLVPRAKLNR